MRRNSGSGEVEWKHDKITVFGQPGSTDSWTQFGGLKMTASLSVQSSCLKSSHELLSFQTLAVLRLNRKDPLLCEVSGEKRLGAGLIGDLVDAKFTSSVHLST
jgi:hypothetical protein